MNGAIIQYSKITKFLIFVTVKCVWSSIGLVENRKRICVFDIHNHCILCPGSGSVHTAQMNDTVSCEYKVRYPCSLATGAAARATSSGHSVNLV